MINALFIVETQRKCETIQSFLPEGCKCINTYGTLLSIHNELLTDKPEIKYKKFDDPKKGRIYDMIRREIDSHRITIIATDNDDEGELQASHIVKLYKSKNISRLLFCEITYESFVSHPRLREEIDYERVKQYENNIALDILYGYTFSPVLWENISEPLQRKQKKKLSASRSLLEALHHLQENNTTTCEEEMKVIASFTNMRIPFEKAIVNDDSYILQYLQKSLYHNHIFTRQEPIKTITPPPEPLNTFTLVSELHSLAPSSHIINACQYLYEMGFITFPKTVSRRLSCAKTIKEYIKRRYGDHCVKTDVLEKEKEKEEEEEGEAIRPKNIELSTLTSSSSPEITTLIKKVYNFIWLKTIQSCMCESVIYTLTANVISPSEDLYTYKARHVAKYGYLIADSKHSELESNSQIYFYLLKLTQVSILQFQTIITRLSVNYKYNNEKILLSNLIYPNYFIVDKLIQRGYITLNPSNEMYTHMTTFTLQDSTITKSSPQILSTSSKFVINVTDLGNSVYHFIHTYFYEFYYEKKVCGQNMKDFYTSIYMPLQKQMLLSIGEFHKNIFQVQYRGIVIGEYMDKKVYIKKGKYGLYLEWHKETRNLSKFGNRPIENIRFDEIFSILEEMACQQETTIISLPEKKETNMIRQVTSDISIRNGKHGHYIFYQTRKMGKPLFFSLNDCSEDYEVCDLESLKTWILQRHHIK
jgi:DNA topoisomerase IA